VLSLSLFSCEKEAAKYPFTVIVQTEDGTRVQNAAVTATAPVANAIPNFTGATDENGMVSFEYDQEAVLQVQATKGENPPSFIGCNFVKLEADNTVTITIVLLPYDPASSGC
jgi:hypothetical protein